MAYIDRLCDKLKVPGNETYMRLSVAAACMCIYSNEEFIKKGYMGDQKCMRLHDRLAGGYNHFEWDMALRAIRCNAEEFGKFFMERVEADGDFWNDYVYPYCRDNDIAADVISSKFLDDFVKTLSFPVSDNERSMLAACLYVSIRDNCLVKKYTGTSLKPEDILNECKKILMVGCDRQLFNVTELACEFATEVEYTLSETTGHSEYEDLFENYVFPYLRENEILPGMRLD